MINESGIDKNGIDKNAGKKTPEGRATGFGNMTTREVRDFKVAVFDAVDLARKAARISQRDLCAEANIAQSTWIRWAASRDGWQPRVMRDVIGALGRLYAVDDVQRATLQESLDVLADMSGDRSNIQPVAPAASEGEVENVMGRDCSGASGFKGGRT